MTSSPESDLPNDSDSESLYGLEFDSDEGFFPETSEKQRSTCDDLEVTERLALSFGDRYPSSGPTFFIRPLDEALQHSLFNPQDPRPLVIYVHDEKSIAIHIFCKVVLSSHRIINYLDAQFIVWPWDRTSHDNYNRLLTMFDNHVGSQVTQKLASISRNSYPLLICLSFDKGEIKITNIIEGNMLLDETYNRLVDAREEFDRRDELPDILDDTCWLSNGFSKENAGISNSILIPDA